MSLQINHEKILIQTERVYFYLIYTKTGPVSINLSLLSGVKFTNTVSVCVETCDFGRR